MRWKGRQGEREIQRDRHWQGVHLKSCRDCGKVAQEECVCVCAEEEEEEEGRRRGRSGVGKDARKVTRKK